MPVASCTAAAAAPGGHMIAQTVELLPHTQSVELLLLLLLLALPLLPGLRS